jgi:threonine dehydrogenase-like Zn-dependent dehydrogenase
MKQVLQNLKDGSTEVAEVPCPRVGAGQLLIRTTRTLVSAGTERMLVDFGKAGFIDKARQQPDKVRMVLDKVRADGLMPTIEAVRNKLDQPLPMGYCNVGEVVEVGVGVTGFAVGDRVASNGKHAEMVVVPVNLCAKVPDAVPDEAAAFTVLGAIALQGIRLVQPTLGETVVVTGLGLIGLVTVQLLKAQGCRVLGLDFDADKLALARLFGAEAVDLKSGVDPVTAAMDFSRGRGVDAVIAALQRHADTIPGCDWGSADTLNAGCASDKRRLHAVLSNGNGPTQILWVIVCSLFSGVCSVCCNVTEFITRHVD